MIALHALGLTLPVLLPGLMLIVSLKKGWFAWARRPLDGGATVAGAPVVGRNKTWFGVALYVVGGALVAGALTLAGGASHAVFAGPRALAVGASIGAAYSLGEILNSLIKRRLGLAPGEETTSRWRGVQRAADLADGIVLAAATYVAWGVGWPMGVTVVALGLAIHAGTDALMRRLSLKRQHQHRSHERSGEIVEPARADTLDAR